VRGVLKAGQKLTQPARVYICVYIAAPYAAIMRKIIPDNDPNSAFECPRLFEVVWSRRMRQIRRIPSPL